MVSNAMFAGLLATVELLVAKRPYKDAASNAALYTDKPSKK
jgi:hypothetical protein